MICVVGVLAANAKSVERCVEWAALGPKVNGVMLSCSAQTTQQVYVVYSLIKFRYVAVPSIRLELLTAVDYSSLPKQLLNMQLKGTVSDLYGQS